MPEKPAPKPKAPRRRAEELTDDQWLLLAPLIPEPPRRPDGKGRPWRSCRAVMNGVLWVLRTGAPWADLPARFPPYQTCHRLFQIWNRTGVLEQALFALARHLKERGGLDVSECFIDAMFAPAKKGAQASGRPSGARVRSSWQWQTALVFLSPCALPVLARMRQRSFKPCLTNASSPRSPSG